MTWNTDPVDEFDATQARLEAIMAEARANTVRASRVADQASTVEATARSSRGELTVTSRAGGVITAIEFSTDALELGPAALARITVTTIAEAQHAAALRFADQAAEELSANSPLADTLRADAERAFPSPNPGGLRY
jgi:hypothetical protein